MDLTTAIRMVANDYRTSVNETAGPGTALEETRQEISHLEVDSWELENDELAQAYHAVIDAEDAEITNTLTEITKALA
jgi:hypothetical protein